MIWLTVLMIMNEQPVPAVDKPEKHCRKTGMWFDVYYNVRAEADQFPQRQYWKLQECQQPSKSTQSAIGKPDAAEFDGWI